MQTAINIAARNLYQFYSGTKDNDIAAMAFQAHPHLKAMYETVADVALAGVVCGCEFEAGYEEAYDDLAKAIEQRLESGQIGDASGVEELQHLLSSLRTAQALSQEDTTVIEDIPFIVVDSPEQLMSILARFGGQDNEPPQR